MSPNAARTYLGERGFAVLLLRVIEVEEVEDALRIVSSASVRASSASTRVSSASVRVSGASVRARARERVARERRGRGPEDARVRFS